MTRQGILLLATIGIGGCDLLDPDTKCTLWAAPGIAVVVIDSLTNGPVSANDITVVAAEGAFSDTAFASAQGGTNAPIKVAEERKGVYTVTVFASGYKPWMVEGIRVTGDECHVRTVDVTVRLQPDGG